ncbi:tail fiber protein [Flavobacterium sp. N1736]|uniref:tail fiber protein n=1 Tax=Flavobacterium sp. N1736 TaxID=2986823 RepID=UPI002224EAE6|nr:tail fiber protein [Flavobacterium sp. N1736]
MKKRLLIVALFVCQINFAQNSFPATGHVGIGTTVPSQLLSLHGSHSDSKFLLHSIGKGDDAGQADLMLWASEPGLTYSGVGIGNNVNNYFGVNLLNPARGGSYIRLLDNSMSFNVVSSAGVDKQAIGINTEGNVGIGTTNPSNIQGWSRVLDVAGIHDSKILATSENASYKVGIFSHNENWYGGGGFVGTESNHSLHLITNYNVKMSILTNGNVGIGTLNPTSKLTVAGNIHAQEVKVTVNAGLVPDYVFANDYKLKSLSEVEDYIKENSHLPEIPSAAEIEKNGLMLAEMNLSLLKKMEEMTLYMIEQNKQIIDLKSRLGKIESGLVK